MSRPTAEDIQLLQNIAPGDVIAMRTYGGWEESWLLQEVTSVTAKRFSCGPHRCFRKKDGREYGSCSSFPAWAFPGTPENQVRVVEYNCKVRNKRRRQDLVQYLRRTTFKHTPLEHLELAVVILKNDKLTLELADRMAWCGVNGLGAADVEDYDDVMAAFEKLWDNLDERIATHEDHRADEGGR